VSDPLRTYRSKSGERRGEGANYVSRLDRTRERRAARRRKIFGRIWRTALPVLFLVVVVVVLLGVFGGGESRDEARGPDTTVEQVPVAGSGLLIIEQSGVASQVVLIHPTSSAGVVLAAPGITLLRSDDGFKTVTELCEYDETRALREALSGALGVAVGPVARVQWSDLRGAMRGSGLADVPAAELGAEGAEAESVAAVMLAFFRVLNTQTGAIAWEYLDLLDDASGFESAVGANKASLEGDWTAAALTGSLAEGEGFKYLEPDARQARALLGG